MWMSSTRRNATVYVNILLYIKPFIWLVQPLRTVIVHNFYNTHTHPRTNQPRNPVLVALLHGPRPPAQARQFSIDHIPGQRPVDSM